MSAFDSLAAHKYVNLETYRRSGVGVRTPVWFAVDDGKVFCYSLAGAGKIKRIRNDGRVRLAPCGLLGELKGDWLHARARIASGAEEALGHRLLDAKYGWQKQLGNVKNALLGKARTVVVIEPDERR